jgi:2-haloacid dehalogenase
LATPTGFSTDSRESCRSEPSQRTKRLVENLQAPFEVVITAEEMGVYKPRLRAFEYTLDKLGVTPDEIVHVSASPKYDLRTAATIGIKNKVYMDRGFEHDEHWLDYKRITDIADLPVLLGLPRP